MSLMDWMFRGGPNAGAAIPPPIVESHTPVGTALAAALRADLEQNGPADLIETGRRHRLRYVVERAPQDLGKAYGRASATIYAQRCEMALLREGIDRWVSAYAEITTERDDLAQALAERRPAPREPWPYAGQEVAPETSPGGGETVEAASVPASTGAPAPGDTHAIAAAADAHLERLAETLAGRDLALTGTTWDRIADRLREYYRALAADTALAGWLPPGTRPAGDRTSQVPVIASLLYQHPRVEGGCSCGWTGTTSHEVHVAEQLVGTGAIA